MTIDVTVIGGGISGLSTAYELMLRGYDVQVLERQIHSGGNAISERFDGYLMEHGPTTFNASVPEAVEQITALGLLDSAHDLGEGVKRRYLRDKGTLTGISTHPMGFFKSNYLSPSARLSMIFEGLRPRRKETGDESIYGFASRRFGREFAEKVIDPLAAGLFMGDSRQLSVSSAFSKLPEMEQKFGSVTKGIIQAKRGSEPGRHLYSWDGGIGTIPDTLTARLGDRVHTGVTVTHLRKAGAGFEIKTNQGTRRSDAVVLAVQPHVAAGLLERLDGDASAAVGDIKAPPINVVFLSYRREQVAHALDGLGYLGTKDGNNIISGAQFSSTMYAGRAPAGYVSIQAYAGGARNPDLGASPIPELTDQVHRELSSLLGITGAPVLTRVRRWQLGLPQYTIGHSARTAVLASTSKRNPGLFLTGNYLQGVSVANCLTSASRTAVEVDQMFSAHKSEILTDKEHLQV